MAPTIQIPDPDNRTPQQIAFDNGVAHERARCIALADGISVAAGRLRRGYGELHPGIPTFAESFECQAELIRNGRWY